MFCKYYYKCIYLTLLLQLCQECMTSKGSTLGKQYMVYLVQSPITRNFQDSWICSGALVSTTHILTAASCLVEAEYLYAIAGYIKYVNAKNIENDDCTRTKKQRVIKIFIPTESALGYENAQSISVNIGVAVVENPYNFEDLTYSIHCNYAPQAVSLNFEGYLDSKDSRAVTLGWGPSDNNILQKTLAMILDKNRCSNTNIFDMSEKANKWEKYYLCVTSINGPNEQTHLLRNTSKTAFSDSNVMFRTENSEEYRDLFDEKLEGNTDTTRIVVFGRKSMKNSDPQTHSVHCQNNPGNILIKSIKYKDFIVGIASSYKTNGNCNTAPYVSTKATAKLVTCMLENITFIYQLCKLELNDEGFYIAEIDRYWLHDSDIPDPIATKKTVLNKQTLSETTSSYDLLYNSKDDQQLQERREDNPYQKLLNDAYFLKVINQPGQYRANIGPYRSQKNQERNSYEKIKSDVLKYAIQPTKLEESDLLSGLFNRRTVKPSQQQQSIPKYRPQQSLAESQLLDRAKDISQTRLFSQRYRPQNQHQNTLNRTNEESYARRDAYLPKQRRYSATEQLDLQMRQNLPELVDALYNPQNAELKSKLPVRYIVKEPHGNMKPPVRQQRHPTQQFNVPLGRGPNLREPPQEQNKKQKQSVRMKGNQVKNILRQFFHSTRGPINIQNKKPMTFSNTKEDDDFTFDEVLANVREPQSQKSYSNAIRNAHSLKEEIQMKRNHENFKDYKEQEVNSDLYNPELKQDDPYMGLTALRSMVRIRPQIPMLKYE